MAKFGDYTILVWASDRGEIPHFHGIRGRDLLVPDFEACIKMQCAEYYPHGDKGGDQLPEEQLGALVGLLNAKDECAGGEHTVWQSLIGIWNRNNKTRAIPLTTPMPDYRKIKWKLPLEDRPKRGTTMLPDGSKVIYDGDLTVLDKDGELVSWASSDLLSILWGDDEDEEDSPDASDEPAKNVTLIAKHPQLAKNCPWEKLEAQFALKGGTAINLFESDLPRLSVDIDLTFLPVTDRQTAIREINAALSRIRRDVARAGIEARLSGGEDSRKILCSRGTAVIKIEPNFILRGTVFPARTMETTPRAEELLGYCRMQALSRDELYGGKFCAALDRQHPRDLFDVAQFFGRGGTVRDVKNGFLAMALGHKRPLHELLAPHPLNQRTTLASQFAGMSDVPFSEEEHEATFRRLVGEIGEAITPEDRRRLVAFTALEADADVFGIPGLEKLPTIQWKRRNLESLRTNDSQRFADNTKALEKVFG